MKTAIHILLMIAFLLPSYTEGQTGLTGIYLDADDFRNGRIKHASKETKIKKHFFFNTNCIEVTHNDSTYVYQKKDVFGYIERNGNKYRLYNNRHLLIENSCEELLLYKTDKTGISKGTQHEYEYYFSKGPQSAVFSLTRQNLEKQFLENKKFRELLEIHFKSDDELMNCDTETNEFKLEQLYKLSNKEKN